MIALPPLLAEMFPGIAAIVLAGIGLLVGKSLDTKAKLAAKHDFALDAASPHPAEAATDKRYVMSGQVFAHDFSQTVGPNTKAQKVEAD